MNEKLSLAKFCMTWQEANNIEEVFDKLNLDKDYDLIKIIVNGCRECGIRLKKICYEELYI